jgi:hypothetical protein
MICELEKLMVIEVYMFGSFTQYLCIVPYLTSRDGTDNRFQPLT